VLVADDHRIVRAGLELLLSAMADIECVGVAGDGAAAVAMVRSLDPDVVLMDLSMPGMDGIAATAAIRAAGLRSRVVALTTFAEAERVTRAIDAGACGYLLKDSDPKGLADAIRAAHAGGAPLDPRAALALVTARQGRDELRPQEPLSAREAEVLGLVSQGLSNRMVARRLGISEKTVKAHLTKVFAAIGVTDRLQAALWWQHRQGQSNQ
jgi:DNA-binding NarL/FixJ family response regulator